MPHLTTVICRKPSRQEQQALTWLYHLQPHTAKQEQFCLQHAETTNQLRGQWRYLLQMEQLSSNRKEKRYIRQQKEELLQQILHLQRQYPHHA